MDKQRKSRSRFREDKAHGQDTPHGSRQICIPMMRNEYERVWRHANVFATEAIAVNPGYAPKTVNTDGWFATQNAFLSIFKTIFTVLCFLHGFLKIRDRCRKARALHDRLWDVYRAATAVEFHERMTAFRKWFEQGSRPKAVMAMTAKRWNRESDYAAGYAHPGCHRTSNRVDRLMNRLTRFLYNGRGLHGNKTSSECRLRGWALLQNFRPFAPRRAATLAATKAPPIGLIKNMITTIGSITFKYAPQ